jgi:MYXO-CTERM domain-containing protein
LTPVQRPQEGGHAPKPNIIFILADDLGYGDLGSFWQDKGSHSAKKFDTPELDRLAAEGVKLTHHYVGAPVCAPSRASLLTGRHQGHADIRDSQMDKPLPQNHTLGTVMRAGGYATAWIGKAGLAGDEGSVNLAGKGSQGLAAHPLMRGFDRFFGYLFHWDAHEHYPRNGTSPETAFIYDGFSQVTNASLDLYTTDAWTAAAKQFMIDEVRAGDKPFFLYLAYDTPHFNMQRPAVAYPALDDDGDPTTGGVQWTLDKDASGNVRYASTANGLGVVDAYTEPGLPDTFIGSEKQHVGMIRRIDRAVADLVRTLKDLGVDDHTVIVFSSDNGPHNEGNDPRTFESFANMEGIKRDLWEAGIRVPTIVRWPDGITRATNDENASFELDRPSATWDWLPTFAELAGVPAPSWADGVSLVPSLTGGKGQRDKGYLYFEFANGDATPDFAEFPAHRGAARGEMQAVRVGNHMGVRTQVASAQDDFRIYDVVNDPGETNDLATSMPELQSRLKTLAITSRRPGAGIVRPYDAEAAPASVPPPGLVNGVRWKRYAGPFPWVPELRDLSPTTIASDTTFAPAKHAPNDNAGLFYTGFVQVPVAGDYTFYVTSDAGASLHIHDAHVIDDDFNHDGAEVSGIIALAAGYHSYRLCYRHAGGEHVLDVKWSGPALRKQSVAPGNLFFDPLADLENITADGGADGAPTVVDGKADSSAGGSVGSADASGDALPRTAAKAGCACSVASAEQPDGMRTMAGWLALFGLAGARIRRRPAVK